METHLGQAYSRAPALLPNMYPAVLAARNLQGQGDWTPTGWLVYNFPSQHPADPRPALHPLWSLPKRGKETPHCPKHRGCPAALLSDSPSHDLLAASVMHPTLFPTDRPRYTPHRGGNTSLLIPERHNFPRDLLLHSPQGAHGDITGHQATALPLEKQPKTGGGGVGRTGAWPALPLCSTALPGAHVGPWLSAYEPSVGSAALVPRLTPALYREDGSPPPRLA